MDFVGKTVRKSGFRYRTKRLIEGTAGEGNRTLRGAGKHLGMAYQELRGELAGRRMGPLLQHPGRNTGPEGRDPSSSHHQLLGIRSERTNNTGICGSKGEPDRIQGQTEKSKSGYNLGAERSDKDPLSRQLCRR